MAAIIFSAVFGLSSIATTAHAGSDDVLKGLGAAALIYGVSKAAKNDRRYDRRYDRRHHHYRYHSAREACFKQCRYETRTHRQYRECIHWRKC